MTKMLDWEGQGYGSSNNIPSLRVSTGITSGTVSSYSVYHLIELVEFNFASSMQFRQIHIRSQILCLSSDEATLDPANSQT